MLSEKAMELEQRAQRLAQIEGPPRGDAPPFPTMHDSPFGALPA